MRHFSHSLFAIYSVLSFTNAALTKCIQDACFNQMAFDGKDSPNRVERINDCKRALVLAIDDDTIFTKTITRTAPTETEYVSIMPRIGATRRGKRDVEGSLDSVDFFPLEERDTFIVKGLPPPYTPSCKNIRQYAIACLCYGVKVHNNQVKTITTTATITPTTTEYVFVTLTQSLSWVCGDGPCDLTAVSTEFGDITTSTPQYPSTIPTYDFTTLNTQVLGSTVIDYEISTAESEFPIKTIDLTTSNTQYIVSTIIDYEITTENSQIVTETYLDTPITSAIFLESSKTVPVMPMITLTATIDDPDGGNNAITEILSFSELPTISVSWDGSSSTGIPVEEKHSS